jgi:hypothetical protein
MKGIENIRDFLERNKVFLETIAAILLSVMAVIVSISQNTIAEKQLILSEIPIISIEPSEDVKGNIGEFELSLRNLSLADLYDIRIYEDYFVSLTSKDGPTELLRFGWFNTKPDSYIEQLKSNEKESFTISFKSIHDDMNQLYSSEVKGQRMKIARLIVKFRRKLDGKEFIQSKAYVIAGHGDTLFDYDERGIRISGEPTFGDIKRLLGVGGD